MVTARTWGTRTQSEAPVRSAVDWTAAPECRNAGVAEEVVHMEVMQGVSVEGERLPH